MQRQSFFETLTLVEGGGPFAEKRGVAFEIGRMRPGAVAGAEEEDQVQGGGEEGDRQCAKRGTPAFGWDENAAHRGHRSRTRPLPPLPVQLAVTVLCAGGPMQPVVPPESELIVQAVAGDESALSDLLVRCGPIVRAHIAPLISNAWHSVLEADDIMQVTYMEAFLRIGFFQSRGEGAFLAWLTSIARNNLRDAVREL